ncbi:pyridoxal phosphate-dependent aminotransferase [Aeromicrobium endophyticum]|uniref:Putative succinyldiaminopimelate transaminase DapC n=1 Tax=Aeromicrobium endophyticum TaxID=2292704 RepID=A0A371PC50_9ACTN|nr:pyridoxal phosphate-dependent aminotransferase [Aeromicrobium endophyticum]REK73467.1 putative succinyldiaminopimelate transaminase DapC [Aeromicrobium endophyticum]
MKTSSARIAGLGTTIFAEMSALAARTGSINLGQGFPDTDGPDEVVDRAVDALRSGRNQYAPGTGVPELRAAIAAHQQRLYGLAVDPGEEVAVTTGATEAIAAALLGLVDPGDEVVVLEPYYDSYVAVIQMAGAVRRPVTLRAPDFRLPLDELRAAVTPRTTAILLNSPHNPTGTVLRRDELEAVAALAVEHDLVVISDEVYEHLTFDGLPHIPIATLPGMAERTLTISSGGKTFSFTGWKVGWATGPATLVRAMLGAKQFLTYTSGSPLQPAIAHALGADDAFFDDLTARMQAQRDLLCEGLAELGLDVFVPEGTYFATTDIRPLGFDDGLEFCRMLPERAGVVAIPHQVFHDSEAGRPLVRWAFCKRPEVIADALERLQALRR